MTENKIVSHSMFMAGGNTESEKNFYQLGYSAANIEKDEEIASWKESKESWEHIASEKDKKIADLKTVMIAAAEEINLHWDAHCDNEGYGPSSLLRRLEQGIPSEYGYTAGRFEEMKQEIERLKGLIRLTHEKAYSNGYTCGQIDNSYYEENCWQTFATENNL